MNTGTLLTVVAIFSIIVIIYLLLRQMVKIIAILLLLGIVFGGYVYIKKGTFPKSIADYYTEAKVLLDQCNSLWREYIK